MLWIRLSIAKEVRIYGKEKRSKELVLGNPNTERLERWEESAKELNNNQWIKREDILQTKERLSTWDSDRSKKEKTIELRNMDATYDFDEVRKYVTQYL